MSKVVEEPNIKLKLFNQVDGATYIPGWFSDEYEKMWRHVQGIPTMEDCANFPRFSNNICMFVTDNNHQVVGMVLAYKANYKDGVVCAGCLIDKQFQKHSYGRNAQVKWIDTLFKRHGFRKVLVENVDEYLTQRYFDLGFTTAGRFKANCKVDGQYVDEVVLECFSEDFKAIYKVNEKEIKVA